MIPFCFLLLVATGTDAFVADREGGGPWRRAGESPAPKRTNGFSKSIHSAALSASMESMDPIVQRFTATSNSPVTETATPLPEPDKLPVNHKIVVLGATGKVGRLVVRQLLEESPDGTQVVAVVRDYDKAIHCLYDDLIATKQNRKSPKLQIVATELVCRSEIPAALDEDEGEIDAAWLKRSQAAAEFYGTEVADYDDGRVLDDDNEHAWEQVMQGCTAIVSCVGSVRPSNPWQDWWLPRLLRMDVRKWCADASHPYYTHFHTTRKVLHLAEREQERRNVLFQAQDAEADEHNDANKELLNRRRDKNALPRRIRFVRLSDLAVTKKPWHVVPLLTNIMRSMVFRYLEMADVLVTQSKLLDTVIVRAGEFVEEERDADEVGIQVSVDGYQILNVTSGRVIRVNLPSHEESGINNVLPSSKWSPARISREDVAALLSASVLAPWLSKVVDNQAAEASSSVHYTLACRWSGDARAMAPYPAQGEKTNGCRTAVKSLQKAVRKRQNQSMAVTRAPRPKPYGVCVVVPLYLTMALLFRNLGRTLWLASRGTKVMGAVALLDNLRPIWQALIRFTLRRTPTVEYISF